MNYMTGEKVGPIQASREMTHNVPPPLAVALLAAFGGIVLFVASLKN